MLYLFGELDRFATTASSAVSLRQCSRNLRLYPWPRSRFIIVHLSRFPRSRDLVESSRSIERLVTSSRQCASTQCSFPVILENDERSRRGTKYRSPPTCSHVQRAPYRVSTIRECVNIRYRLVFFVHVFGRSRAFCAHRLYGNWRAHRPSPVIPCHPSPLSRCSTVGFLPVTYLFPRGHGRVLPFPRSLAERLINPGLPLNPPPSSHPTGTPRA